MSDIEKLGDLAAIDYGYTAKASFEVDGPKFLRITDLTAEGVDWRAVPQCPINDADLNKHKLLQDDIVFARTGATTGKSFLIKETPTAVAASYLIRLRLNDPRCLPEYVASYFQTKEYWDEIQRGMTGSAQGGFNATKLKNLSVPIPSLSEQKRIVAILDEAFGAIARAKENAERNLANARELFDSYLNRVFTEKGEGWEEETLGNICGFVRGPFGGSLKKSCFVEKGYAVYEQQHAIYNQFESVRYFVDESKFNEMKRFELMSGDLIMSCSGTIGKVAVVPADIKRGIINQALLKLSPGHDISPFFLKYWMMSYDFDHQIMKHSKGVAIKNVASVKTLKGIRIHLPSLAEQEKIVERFDSFTLIGQSLERVYQQKIAALDELKQSLLQKAFTGQLTSKTKELELVP